MGMIIANCSVVLEGGRCVAELEKQAKEVVALKKADQSVDEFNNAKKAHVEWVRKGWLVDEDSSLKLDRKESYVVVKFLLPRINIKEELKLKDFGMMKNCNKWLGEIRRGMTWDECMVVVVEESRAELGPPLFALGEAW